jgi:ubiquitin carboxyl-terminal hydrolase 4/11/15
VDVFSKSDAWKADCNWTSPVGTRCEVVEAFAGFMRELWAGRERISPRSFKFTVGKFAGQFSGYSQQDAAEFLTFLLDLVHEDLNRVHERPVTDPVFGDGDDDIEVSELAWLRYKQRNDSIIVDICHGQLRFRNICPICHRKTIVFDPFVTLSTPLPIPRQM